MEFKFAGGRKMREKCRRDTFAPFVASREQFRQASQLLERMWREQRIKFWEKGNGAAPPLEAYQSSEQILRLLRHWSGVHFQGRR